MDVDEHPAPAESAPPAPPAMRPIYRYEFFAVAIDGSVVKVPIYILSPESIDSAKVRTILDQTYLQLIQDRGIGAVPRPTHCVVAELQPLSGMRPVGGESPISLFIPQNGESAGGGGVAADGEGDAI